ncbi:MAG: two-component system, chemotaxis family, sensor kinase CheA, partial [Chloroflexota bacterium]|nr:two-component system, chemotaxis family, sensor kinase CheA [Chloroflexota bacterium]
MALESAPDDQATIDGILREAHTMKGAAGMVGMMRVSRLAHRLEDLLVELRSGERRSTPELTDSMLLVVDGLARLVASPSSGDQDMSDEAAMERLLPTSGAVVSATSPAPAETIAPSIAPAKPAPPPAPNGATSPASGEVIAPKAE